MKEIYLGWIGIVLLVVAAILLVSSINYYCVEETTTCKDSRGYEMVGSTCKGKVCEHNDVMFIFAFVFGLAGFGLTFKYFMR